MLLPAPILEEGSQSQAPPPEEDASPPPESTAQDAQPPLLPPALQQQQQQMMMYPYMYAPMMPPSGFASPSLSPEASLPASHSHAQYQQPLMYQQMMASPPPPLPSMQPEAAMGYAQGTIPPVNLGLDTNMKPRKQIISCYGLLLVSLLTSLAVFLGAFFITSSTETVLFSRRARDTMQTDLYSTSSNRDDAPEYVHYAIYAPCAVFKRHGCDIITSETAYKWISMTSGIRAPFAQLLGLSRIIDARITKCSYFIPDSQMPSYDNHVTGPVTIDGNETTRTPLQTARPIPVPSVPVEVNRTTLGAPALIPSGLLSDRTIHSIAPIVGLQNDRNSPQRSLLDQLKPPNQSGVRVDIDSLYPDAAQAAFFLTCSGDKNTVKMVRIQFVLNANLSLLRVPNATATSMTLSKEALRDMGSTSAQFTQYFSGLTACAQSYLYCSAPDYFLFAETSELRRCGGGPLIPGAGIPSSDPDQSYQITICDLLDLENPEITSPNSLVSIVVWGAFVMNMSLHPVTAYFPGVLGAIRFKLAAPEVAFLMTEGTMLAAVLLAAVAAYLVPKHRRQLRELKSTLEADAVVAMEILYRAQGAFQGAPTLPDAPLDANTAAATPAPGTDDPPDEGAFHDADADSAVEHASSPLSSTSVPSAQPMPVLPPSSTMYVVSPFFRPVPGVETMQLGGGGGGGPMGNMMMMPPQMMLNPYAQMQPPPSPYGEGHYLSPEELEEEEEEDQARHSASVATPAPLTPSSGFPSTVGVPGPETSGSAVVSLSVHAEKPEEEAAEVLAPGGILSPNSVQLVLSDGAPQEPDAAMTVPLDGRLHAAAGGSVASTEEEQELVSMPSDAASSQAQGADAHEMTEELPAFSPPEAPELPDIVVRQPSAPAVESTSEEDEASVSPERSSSLSHPRSSPFRMRPPPPLSLEDQERIRRNPALLLSGSGFGSGASAAMFSNEFQSSPVPSGMTMPMVLPTAPRGAADTRSLLPMTVMNTGSRVPPLPFLSLARPPPPSQHPAASAAANVRGREDVSQSSSASTPRSPGTRTRLQRLRDRFLRLRAGASNGEGGPAVNYLASDSEDGLGDPGAVVDPNYLRPEASPGERTIHLFVTRARKSYYGLRRKQVKLLMTLLLYANVLAALATIEMIITMAFKLSRSFLDFSGKLQMRPDDTLRTFPRINPAFAAMTTIAVVAAIVALALLTVIRRRMVW